MAERAHSLIVFEGFIRENKMFLISLFQRLNNLMFEISSLFLPSGEGKRGEVSQRTPNEVGLTQFPGKRHIFVTPHTAHLILSILRLLFVETILLFLFLQPLMLHACL